MIHVVTDSTASLPPELVETYGIHVVPQIVSFGGEVFREGLDLSIAEFYKRLSTAQQLPTTSQPSAGEFAELFGRLTADNGTVLVIVVSNELSGSYLSAQGAKEMLPGADIHVIDSRSVSAPLGFMALEAARMAQAGADQGDQGACHAHERRISHLFSGRHAGIPAPGWADWRCRGIVGYGVKDEAHPDHPRRARGAV